MKAFPSMSKLDAELFYEIALSQSQNTTGIIQKIQAVTAFTCEPFECSVPAENVNTLRYTFVQLLTNWLGSGWWIDGWVMGRRMK
jgi:hypothetical protein